MKISQQISYNTLARGNGVVIIDPSTDEVTKTVSFAGKDGEPQRQVKGLVKGADNNFHIAVTGEFTGEANNSVFISNPKIVGIDHDGNQLYEHILSDDIKFSAATWVPSINMAASFKKNHIYLVTSDDFNIRTASRFDYETKSLEKDLIAPPNDENLYGYMGVHPTTETLYVGASPNFIRSEIYEYAIGADNKPVLKETHEFRLASPAGMDFGYRFSDEFINR